MKLIPSDISIYDQFRRYEEFLTMVEKWSGNSRYHWEIDLEKLEKESGVRCRYRNSSTREGLVGFDVVDTKAYSIFVLRWL